jgi:hypothetical protein
LHNAYYLMKPNGDLLSHPYNGTHLAPWNSVQEGVLSEPNPTNTEPLNQVLQSLELCHHCDSN